jgi:hypothetical protein
MRLQRSSTFAIGVFHCGRKVHKEDHRSKKSNLSFVRIADIGVHYSEGLLRSPNFESERYGPHAYHGDDVAF